VLIQQKHLHAWNLRDHLLHIRLGRFEDVHREVVPLRGDCYVGKTTMGTDGTE
jgi:hypothetical protein